MFIYSLPLTPQFQTKRHAQGKRRNSVTARRNTQNGGCKGVRYVCLLFLSNQIGNCKLEMRKLFLHEMFSFWRGRRDARLEINIRELKHKTPLSTRTSNSRGETGSTPAQVTWLNSVKHVTSLLYYGYTACWFDSFFFISAISQIITFFETIRDMLFQCDVQRLFSVDKHTLLLEENPARNPEFDFVHITWIIITSEFKANLI